jgi:TRAP-type C4-dicarboxylate transport system substrate-binding protein
MTISKFKSLFWGGLLVFNLSGVLEAQDAVIKFATLAPEGSNWMKVMDELNADLQKRTQGHLRFRLYPGGISGDDKDVLRKIRIGELQAAGFTGVGLGLIAPKVRILDAPWLFKNVQELNDIHKQFDPYFEKAFEKNGFECLGFTDLGFVYLFSRDPLQGPDDMRRTKMWMWEGDPIAQAAFTALGVTPIPLSVIDVMSSLQTGLINAVYGPPLGVVALQWFTRTKYIYPVPLAYSSGAVLISKRFFDSLPTDQQKILKDLSSVYLKKLTQMTRAENQEALQALEAQGLILSPEPPASILALYEKIGTQARHSLVGKLYPADLLIQIESTLSQLRAHPSKN